MNGMNQGTPMGGPPHEDRGEQLKVPGIVLIIVGILGLLNQVYTLIRSGGGGELPNMDQLPPQAQEIARQTMAAGPFIGVLALVLAVVVILGGFQMVKRGNWTLAMAGAITATIPCIGSCCCLGLPFGIWALVLLLRPDVKASFASQRGGFPPPSQPPSSFPPMS